MKILEFRNLSFESVHVVQGSCLQGRVRMLWVRRYGGCGFGGQEGKRVGARAFTASC